MCQAREHSLHSVEAEFWVDGVVCGLAELTYSNGVSMKVTIGAMATKVEQW